MPPNQYHPVCGTPFIWTEVTLTPWHDLPYQRNTAKWDGVLQHPNEAFIVYSWAGCMISLRCSSLQGLLNSSVPLGLPTMHNLTPQLSPTALAASSSCFCEATDFLLQKQLFFPVSKVIYSFCVKHPNTSNLPIWSVFNADTVCNCSSFGSQQPSLILSMLFDKLPLSPVLFKQKAWSERASFSAFPNCFWYSSFKSLFCTLSAISV